MSFLPTTPTSTFAGKAALPRCTERLQQVVSKCTAVPLRLGNLACTPQHLFATWCCGWRCIGRGCQGAEPVLGGCLQSAQGLQLREALSKAEAHVFLGKVITLKVPLC